VLLHVKGGRVAVVIEDDGRGFAEGDETTGIGLLGMRERVALVNGSVTVESSPGAGTTIVVEVPEAES
jgi:signal transduction histidine kinase